MSARREMPIVVLLAAAAAAGTFLHGFLAYRSARTHLDGLLLELGGAIADSAAAGLRSSHAMLGELEAEIDSSLRMKASFFTRSGEERDRDESRLIARFAPAAGLRYLFLFDASGELVAASRDIPSPGAADIDPSRLQLPVEQAARELARQASEGTVVRELAIPESGLKPSLAAAVPLPRGGTAVLVQDTEAFARVREAASPEAWAQRLESETRILFARFNEPAPATDRPALLLDRDLELAPGLRGTLRLGLDRTPVEEALALQRRAALLDGALLVAGITLAAWVLLRLRRAREEMAARLQRDERLASLGGLAAGIAHEVRNPLNAIGLAAQRVERGEGDPAESRRLAGVISEEVDRLNRLVEDILRYARPQKARRIRIDARQWLAAVEALARPEAQRMGVRLEVTADDLEVNGDPDLLRGAAWNLVRNALQASPAGGSVSVRVSRSGSGAALEVRDRGPGVPPERRAEIFTPFLSDRAGGSGLGLPLALSAAQAHGGTIEVRDAPGGGALFVMTIPEGT